MIQASLPPELIRDLTERYAAEGYVPAGLDRVPAALRAEGSVDLVFARGDHTVLVQLKRAPSRLASSQGDELTRLARAVRAFPQLRLDVVSMPDPMDVIPDRALILKRADAAATLLLSGSDPHVIEAALLLAAAAAEGALIRLLRQREVLAPADPDLADLAATAWSEGFMTQEQWDDLQIAIDRRNAVAHGLAPGARPNVTDVETLIECARTFADPGYQSALDIANWFFEHYKDPADGVPFDSAEGGYQYVNGGPFDAEEVLAEQYPETPPDVLRLALAQIESYGFDWVRVEDY